MEKEIESKRQIAELITCLAEAETRLKILADATMEGIIIHENGVALEVNDTLSNLSGYSRGELLGKDLLEVFVPNEYKDFVKGKLDSKSEDAYEIEVKHKDGSRFPVEVRGRHIVFNGRSASAVVIWDSSRQNKAERSLLASEERFRNLFENSSDFIYTSDLRGLFTSANKALLGASGYTKEEIVGKPITVLVAPESLEKARKMTEAKLKGLPDTRYELVVIAKDGHPIHIDLSSQLIYEEGKVAGIQGIGRDMTETLKTQAELRGAKEVAERATKLKDKFVTLVAHDLMAPLSSISGLLELSITRPDSILNDEAKKMFTRILTSCNGMLTMIKNILNLSKLQGGRIKLERTEVDCHRLTEERIKILSHYAETKGLEIKNKIKPGMRVFADYHLLGECLANLIANAIKFTNRAGEIEVFNPEGLKTTIAVRDNGVGVEPRFIEHLFDPSEKTVGIGTSGEVGTGFGLTYCMEIMEAHGGSITVESGKGKGSTFFLNFPE
jgi:PAS domain S-box-containing protein